MLRVARRDGHLGAEERHELFLVAGPGSMSERVQPLKTRKGSAKSAASPKLRTRVHKNCEHALVACSQFSLPLVTTGVRWDS